MYPGEVSNKVIRTPNQPLKNPYEETEALVILMKVANLEVVPPVSDDCYPDSSLTATLIDPEPEHETKLCLNF